MPDSQNHSQDALPVKIGQFAILRVVSLENVGAFLDWGLPKDLLLPFREQTRDVRVGEEIVVFVYYLPVFINTKPSSMEFYKKFLWWNNKFWRIASWF